MKEKTMRAVGIILVALFAASLLAGCNASSSPAGLAGQAAKLYKDISAAVEKGDESKRESLEARFNALATAVDKLPAEAQEKFWEELEKKGVTQQDILAMLFSI